MTAGRPEGGALESHLRLAPSPSLTVPLVVFVHGAADRGAAFVKVARDLPHTDVIRYDRRGYGRSLGLGVDLARTGAEVLADSVRDLLGVLDGAQQQRIESNRSGPVVLVGHSVGGLVALATAIAAPEQVNAVVAWEPPTPWQSWWSRGRGSESSQVDDNRERRGAEVMEAFLRQRLGDEHWDQLGEGRRRTRQAEGMALVDDIAAAKAAGDLSLGVLRLPVTLGVGTLTDQRHQRAVEELAEVIPAARVATVDGAAHDAHMTHPAAFAAVVSECVGSIAP